MTHSYSNIRILAIGASVFLFAAPTFAQANTASDQAATSMSQSSASQAEAKQMVPADVSLLDSIDAKKVEPGASFKAKLNSKVRLANGSELPSGTIIDGAVASDDMNLTGNCKLALRFTKAELKNGTSIPIKATIVGVFAQPSQAISPAQDTMMNVSNGLNDGTLALDQVGVMSGVDLHSNVASQNSGVFVAATKGDVKLSKGSDIGLAIAPGQVNQQESSQMSPTGSPAGL